MDRNDRGYKGYKGYTPRFLRTYDRWVLGFMVPRVWKTGSEPAVDVYRRYMGRRHLDVGPGTGFLITESDPPRNLDLTLLDPNPHVLEHCAERLAAWSPALVQANVLDPLPVDGPFDSAALSHVIHCLPGPMAEKASAIENIATVLSEKGVLFGGTVLGLSADHTWAARAFLRAANRQGGFDNRQDDVHGLRELLEASFEDVDVQAHGSIAYFVASRPRRRTQE